MSVFFNCCQDDEVVKPESEKIKYEFSFLMNLKPLFITVPEVVAKNFAELVPNMNNDDDGIAIVNLTPLTSATDENSSHGNNEDGNNIGNESSANTSVPSRFTAPEEDTRDWRARPTFMDKGNDDNDRDGGQWGHKAYEEAKMAEEMKMKGQAANASNISSSNNNDSQAPISAMNEKEYDWQKKKTASAPSSNPNVSASSTAPAPPTAAPATIAPTAAPTSAVNSVSSLSAAPLPEIKRTKNAWRPNRGNGSTEGDHKTKLVRSVRDVLNKLTPEKFEKLVAQMLELGIGDTVENLGLCIVQVFEKAVAEPHFTELYADLCAALSKKLPEIFVNNRPVSFRRVLLNTCQEEFEGTNDARERLTSIRDADVRSAEEEKVKRRTLGNIRLIGELFKKQMVQEKIVHVCIAELLHVKQDKGEELPTEENIEALCHLLATVGKQVDSNSVRSKALMDSYIKRLLVLSQNNNLHSRMRFMCKDVSDLRDSEWVPRRKKEKAKKLKEVKKWTFSRIIISRAFLVSVCTFQ